MSIYFQVRRFQKLDMDATGVFKDVHLGLASSIRCAFS